MNALQIDLLLEYARAYHTYHNSNEPVNGLKFGITMGIGRIAILYGVETEKLYNIRRCIRTGNVDKLHKILGQVI